MLDFNAQHIGYSSSVQKILPRRTMLGIIVIFPVLHENAEHFMALLLEQIRADGRINAAT